MTVSSVRELVASMRPRPGETKPVLTPWISTRLVGDYYYADGSELGVGSELGPTEAKILQDLIDGIDRGEIESTPEDRQRLVDRLDDGISSRSAAFVRGVTEGTLYAPIRLLTPFGWPMLATSIGVASLATGPAGLVLGPAAASVLLGVLEGRTRARLE